MLQKNFKILLLFLFAFVLLSPNLFSESYAGKLSITEQRCKHHLSKYIQLGEFVYKERYKHNRVVDDCIKFFKDSDSSLFYTAEIIPVKTKNNSVKLLTDTSIGKNYHLLKYQICNDEKDPKRKIIFQSNYETSLIVLPKSVAFGTCTVFWTEFKFENPNSIKLSWDDGNMKNLKIRKIL